MRYLTLNARFLQQKALGTSSTAVDSGVVEVFRKRIQVLELAVQLYSSHRFSIALKCMCQKWSMMKMRAITCYTLHLFPELGEIPVRFFSELVLRPRLLPSFDTIDHYPLIITTDPHAFTLTLAPRTIQMQRNGLHSGKTG